MLDPRLQSLSPEHLRLWCDPAARKDALGQLLFATSAGSDVERGLAIRSIDDAVTCGLRVLDLPRGSVRTVDVLNIPDRGWKDEECNVLIGLNWIEEAFRDGHADSVFRTWVHESIHARAPFARGWRLEYRHAPGYEEGLTEGLARVVSVDIAGMRPRINTAHAFVLAYEGLAAAIGVSAESLWRSLWRCPTGSLRSGLIGALSEVYTSHHSTDFTEEQSLRIIQTADDLFAGPRVEELPNRVQILQGWRRALE